MTPLPPEPVMNRRDYTLKLRKRPFIPRDLRVDSLMAQMRYVSDLDETPEWEREAILSARKELAQSLLERIGTGW